MQKGWCTIEGCNKRAMARGWCSTHYHRWRKSGDPLVIRPRKKYAGRPSDEPYLKLRIEGKVIYVHRKVMEEKLGRPLLPGETVHHIDGNTRNNSPENLELFQSQSDHARYHNYNRRT